MSNTYYYACTDCGWLIGTVGGDIDPCPFGKHSGLDDVGDAEDYQGEDDEGFNYGFPEGQELSKRELKIAMKIYGHDEDIRDLEINENDNPNWDNKTQTCKLCGCSICTCE